MTLIITHRTEDLEVQNHVALPVEVLVYFAKQSQFPHIMRLGELDPYSDCTLDGDFLVKLLPELVKALSEAKARKLSAPPRYVGLEGNRQPELADIFGWSGLERLLEGLQLLCANHRLLLVIGD